MSLAELVGFFAGAMVIVVPIAKWFLNDWDKKTQKIEKLRAQRIGRMEEEAKQLREVVHETQMSIVEHSKKLGTHEASMRVLSEKINDSMDRFQGYERKLNDRVKEEIRSQIRKLTEEIKAIRARSGKG